MATRKVFAKVLAIDKRPTGKVVDITDKIWPYIELDGKKYHYAYDIGCYIEDSIYDEDDDIPF